MSNPISSASVASLSPDQSAFKPPAFHADTWYQHECGSAKEYRPLEQDVHCKTVIVGAGLAGLSAAASLVDRGYFDIAILEQGQPGEGASGRNGGFVFGGFSRSPGKLAKQVGIERSHALQQLTHEAVERVRRRCRMLAVPIHEHGVLLVDWFKQPDRLKAYAEDLKRVAGIDFDYLSPDELDQHLRSKRYGAALMEANAFHFNPLQYVRALSEWLLEQGVQIFGHSRAHNLKPLGKYSGQSRWSISANGSTIQAEQVLLASGGYGQGYLPWLQRQIQPIATYIAVTEPLGPELDQLLPSSAAVYDNRFAFDYYRKVAGRKTAENRLLWGGRISILDRSPKRIEQLMRKDIRRVFPELADAPFEFSWGGWMSYARHEMPILAEPEPGLWQSIAFGGHGMAPTTVAGEILAAAMCGQNQGLEQFQTWPPVWAGGSMGRMYAQANYMTKQAQDRLRAFWAS